MKTNNAIDVQPRDPLWLRHLAQDIADQKVFTTWQLPFEDAGSFAMVFIPLALMRRRQLQWLQNHAGLTYEYLNKALSIRHENHPTFMSVQFLTKSDTALVQQFVHDITMHRALTAEP